MRPPCYRVDRARRNSHWIEWIWRASRLTWDARIMRSIGFAFLTLFLAARCLEAAGPPTRVVVLIPVAQGTATVGAFEEALHASLEQALGANLDYSTEYMANPAPDEEYRVAIRDYLRRKYAQPPDVVVAVGRLSLEFARDHGREAFANAALVGVIDLDNKAELLTNRSGGLPVTGVVVKRDIKGTLDLILKLQPTTRE